MRLKTIGLVAILAAAPLPAFAQSRYSDACTTVRGDRQAAGAVIGGLLGGLAGNGLASRKTRDEGAIVGAIVGAVAGSEIARSGVRCPSGYEGSSVYGATGSYGYPNDRYSNYPYNSDLAGGPGRYDDYHDDDDDWNVSDRYRYDAPHAYPYPRNNYPLADYGRHDNNGSKNASRECAPVRQTTRLPDGTTEVRIVDACREAYYGDWRIRD